MWSRWRLTTCVDLLMRESGDMETTGELICRVAIEKVIKIKAIVSCGADGDLKLVWEWSGAD